MFKSLGKKESFTSPISGNIIPLEQVNDPVFSQKMMGDGLAIQPIGKTIFAPMSGTITMCFPTNHAIGMKTEHGIEILIHIGIDTVKLAGLGFTALVQQDQIVKQGEPLITFDLNEIQAKGYDATVIVIFTNREITLKQSSVMVKEHQPIAVGF